MILIDCIRLDRDHAYHDNPRIVIAKFADCNIYEKVFKAWKKLR